MKHIIWSNLDINPEDWKDDYKEYCEENDIEYHEDDVYTWATETNSMYFDDEKCNLNKQLDGRILCIASLGLWNGRKQGYKILGANLNDIFNVGGFDYAEFYSDGYNIKGAECHHDGTNYYEFRLIREDRNIDNLLDAIYNGEQISRQKLNKYTKSLHKYVAEIYGW